MARHRLEQSARNTRPRTSDIRGWLSGYSYAVMQRLACISVGLLANGVTGGSVRLTSAACSACRSGCCSAHTRAKLCLLSWMTCIECLLADQPGTLPMADGSPRECWGKEVLRLPGNKQRKQHTVGRLGHTCTLLERSCLQHMSCTLPSLFCAGQRRLCCPDLVRMTPCPGPLCRAAVHVLGVCRCLTHWAGICIWDQSGAMLSISGLVVGHGEGLSALQLSCEAPVQRLQHSPVPLCAPQGSQNL